MGHPAVHVGERSPWIFPSREALLHIRRRCSRYAAHHIPQNHALGWTHLVDWSMSFETSPLPTLVDPSDALGRPKELTRKKDFSDTDLKMALNAGTLFETPEKFFLNASQRIHSHFDVSGSIRLCDVVRTQHKVELYC